MFNVHWVQSAIERAVVVFIVVNGHKMSYSVLSIENQGTNLIVKLFVILFYHFQYALNLHLLQFTQ